MSASELFPTLAHVVCECGRIYFDGQNDALWACARRHAEERKAMREYQALVERSGARP